ncbi:hypothetical protein MRB53_002976 [Persea americana]|uniref:Uncharacterized protein n=1 Tax=Persea americana TaxID=3435 RepID=A0ACC2MWQ1_PERAE|nr:hypothetical protein MRB53_002976 [Persea americana]
MFIQLLVSVENEGPFGLLYCITFKLMDQQWLAMHASYMNFNYLPISYDVHTSSAGKRDAAQKHITP